MVWVPGSLPGGMVRSGGGPETGVLFVAWSGAVVVVVVVVVGGGSSPGAVPATKAMMVSSPGARYAPPVMSALSRFSSVVSEGPMTGMWRLS